MPIVNNFRTHLLFAVRCQPWLVSAFPSAFFFCAFKYFTLWPQRSPSRYCFSVRLHLIYFCNFDFLKLKSPDWLLVLSADGQWCWLGTILWSGAKYLSSSASAQNCHFCKPWSRRVCVVSWRYGARLRALALFESCCSPRSLLPRTLPTAATVRRGATAFLTQQQT